MGEIEVIRSADGSLAIRIAGSWRLQEGLPDPATVEAELTSDPRPRALVFDTARLTSWDSGILTFLARIIDLAGTRGIEADRSGLPAGVQRMLALAEVVWSPTSQRSWSDFSRRLPAVLDRLRRLGINYRPFRTETERRAP